MTRRDNTRQAVAFMFVQYHGPGAVETDSQLYRRSEGGGIVAVSDAEFFYNVSPTLTLHCVQ